LPHRRSFRVSWTEQAVRDLEEIALFLAVDSPEDAGAFLEGVRAKSESLKTLPFRGRVVPELAHFGIRSRRELIVRPYRILYRVEKTRVYVLAVLDSRRDLRALLLERLIRDG
jgi:plasmid stabilization system protein ParE